MANLTQNFNYLQPTSFKLVIDRKNYPNLQFFCQNFVHPGMIMNAPEIPFRNITGIPLAGSKLTFNELSANILLDEDMKAYDEMFAWMRRILSAPEVNPLICSPNNRSVVPPSTVLIDDNVIFGADGSLVSVDSNIPKISKTSGVLRDIFSSCTRVPKG